MEQPSSPGAPSPRDPRLTQEQLTALALGADPERVSLTQLYLSVKGRIPRRTFWLHGVLSLLALAFVINCLMEIARIGDNIAVWTVILGFAWPFIAVTTKRLHDFNLSAWWLPLGVAGIGLLLMLVFSFSAWWLLGNFVGLVGTDPLHPRHRLDAADRGRRQHARHAGPQPLRHRPARGARPGQDQ
jgi:uncharacterized membrane protein YhaH (DUF805 family)